MLQLYSIHTASYVISLFFTSSLFQYLSFPHPSLLLTAVTRHFCQTFHRGILLEPHPSSLLLYCNVVPIPSNPHPSVLALQQGLTLSVPLPLPSTPDTGAAIPAAPALSFSPLESLHYVLWVTL